MKNEYDSWHILKSKINHKIVNLFPKEREVWIAHVGKNIGYEQNGSGTNYVRPVLVLKKFNNLMFWIIPLSTKQKEFDFYFNFQDEYGQNVSLIISQLRLMSVNRFDRKMYELNFSIFGRVKLFVKKILD